MDYERYRVLFEQLGDLGFERGRIIMGITVGVLMIPKAYKDRKKLEVLAKLIGEEEGFGDDALHLEARRSLLPLLEKAHKAGEVVTEEEVLDGIMGIIALRDTCVWTNDFDGVTCFERMETGYDWVQGEDHAKSVDATLALLSQTTEGDACIAEFRALWERAKLTLPDEAVTYDITNNLGERLRLEGSYEESKVIHLAALERRRRVLGDEHKKTLGSLHNMGAVLQHIEDYEGALDYYQQALRVSLG